MATIIMMMKKIKLFVLLLLITTVTFAQKSPRKQATGKIAGANVEVDYGAPSVRDRAIWGGLVPYAKVWRAGANENTTVSFDKDVTIDGNKVPAGKYGFFIIPNEDAAWIVIFSKKNDAWGSNGYSADNDLFRMKVKPKFADESVEQMGFKVGEKAIGFAWEKARLKIPVK
jgi:hypothetical protein